MLPAGDVCGEVTLADGFIENVVNIASLEAGAVLFIAIEELGTVGRMWVTQTCYTVGRRARESQKSCKKTIDYM